LAELDERRPQFLEGKTHPNRAIRLAMTGATKGRTRRPAARYGVRCSASTTSTKPYLTSTLSRYSAARLRRASRRVCEAAFLPVRRSTKPPSFSWIRFHFPVERQLQLPERHQATQMAANQGSEAPAHTVGRRLLRILPRLCEESCRTRSDRVSENAAGSSWGPRRVSCSPEL
jgi:hypothetical protein